MPVEVLEQTYPRGTRVMLVEAKSAKTDWCGLRAGELGTVRGVDPTFVTLDVLWDNGANFDLVPNCDRFSVVAKN